METRVISVYQRVLNVRIIEYQAFLPLYDLAPSAPSPPLSRQQIVSLSQSPGGGRGWSLLTGKGGGGGEGAKSYEGEKAWYSIYNPL
jgi:hypothetical protein